jgi:hypothetical protein
MQVVDDQARRAEIVSRYTPVVVSSCETHEERSEAVSHLLEIDSASGLWPDVDLDGSDRAAEEIMALVDREMAA